jgi:hypothetical protein
MTTYPAFSRYRTIWSGSKIGHEFIAPVKALSPVEAKGERDGMRKVARIGGRQLFIRHTQTIARG